MHLKFLPPAFSGGDWHLQLGDEQVPLVGFQIEQTEGSKVAVSLTALVDSVHLGDNSTNSPAPDMRPSTPQPRTWGSAAPDPREHIPGWRPETLADQAAGQARGVHETSAPHGVIA